MEIYLQYIYLYLIYLLKAKDKINRDEYSIILILENAKTIQLYM